MDKRLDDPFCPLESAERQSQLHSHTGKEDLATVLPIPKDAPDYRMLWRGKPEPTDLWAYLNESGGLLCYTARFDNSNGTKAVLTLTLWRTRSGTLTWRYKPLPSPRPLYGLDHLLKDKHAPVLVVEGEKCADAAQAAFP